MFCDMVCHTPDIFPHGVSMTRGEQHTVTKKENVNKNKE
jgi:hypothetical protein